MVTAGLSVFSGNHQGEGVRFITCSHVSDCVLVAAVHHGKLLGGGKGGLHLSVLIAMHKAWSPVSRASAAADWLQP